MSRVVSGIRPTGKLHLGNYFGAVYDNKVTEVGLYFHDKGGVSTFTGADYTDTQQVLASIKYKF